MTKIQRLERTVVTAVHSGNELQIRAPVDSVFRVGMLVHKNSRPSIAAARRGLKLLSVRTNGKVHEKEVHPNFKAGSV